MSDPSDESKSRRDAIEPVHLKAQGPIRPATGSPGAMPPSREALLRRLTFVGFAVLLVLAIGVFFFLPSAVERSRHPDGANEQQAEAMPPDEQTEEERAPLAARSGPDDAEQLQQRREVEDLLAEFVERGEALDASGVAEWAGAEREASIERAREGERLLRRRDYAQAGERLSEALERITELELRRDTLKAEALRAGRLALEAGRGDEAREQFELAALIDPADASAQAGLARSETIGEVFALLAAGEALEQRGELVAARETYDRAAALDPALEILRDSSKRVSDRITRKDFQAAMSKGFTQLARHDYNGAASEFERALRIRPDSAEARDGLAQAREAGRIRSVAEHREAAEQAEVEENWDQALWHYQQALQLDPQLAFAQAGAEHSRDRAATSRALEKYLSQPERLSSEQVRREASEVLARADAVRTPGPVLRSQIDRVAALLEAMSTPVRVELLSDAKTDVLLYRVGRLGRFEARQLDLKPGRYTVVGTRDGYRDVRTQFTVDAGVSPDPVMVRCEEQI